MSCIFSCQRYGFSIRNKCVIYQLFTYIGFACSSHLASVVILWYFLLSMLQGRDKAWSLDVIGAHWCCFAWPRFAGQEQPLPGNEWTPEQWAEWQRWQCGTESSCQKQTVLSQP